MISWSMEEEFINIILGKRKDNIPLELLDGGRKMELIIGSLRIAMMSVLEKMDFSRLKEEAMNVELKLRLLLETPNCEEKLFLM